MLRHNFLAVAKVQEGMLNHASTFQTSAHIMAANISLAKSNQKMKPKVQGGEIHCMYCEALTG